MFPLEHDGHFLLSIALGGVFGGPVLDEASAAQRRDEQAIREAPSDDVERAVWLLGVLGDVGSVLFVASCEPTRDRVRAELAASLLVLGEEGPVEELARQGTVGVPGAWGTLARLAARRGDRAKAVELLDRGLTAAGPDLMLHRLQGRLAEPGPYVDRYDLRAEAVGLALEFGLELRGRLQNAHGWAIDDVLIELAGRARALDPLYPEPLLQRVQAVVTGG